MRMSHANLHLDTNATLTDTCVRQKVQAAITARQGQTHLNFKSSQPSLEIISNYWYIYDNVCTLLICFHFKTTSFQRHHPIYLQRRVERSAQLLTKSTNNLSADVKLQCQQICMILTNEEKKIQVGLFLQKRASFRWISYKQKYCQVWRKTRRNEWRTGRDWHSYPILVLFSGNWRHIQTHKLYHPWLSLLNVWSSQNISLLSRWYISLIDQSHWHRRSQVVSKAARNKRTTTGGSPKTSAPAQIRPTTERALFCSASYSLTLRRSTRPLVQPTQKSYNCITITIYIWVSSEHTTISSLPDIYF